MKSVAVTAFMILAIAVASYASDCQQTTYDQYTAVGSCGIGNMTFSDFSYSYSSNPPGYGLPAGSIMTTPITTAYNPGLQFSGGWYASTSSGILEEDSLFQFAVTSPTNSINDLSLSIAGVGFAGTGAIMVDETACLGAMLPVCTGGTIVTLHVFDSSSGQQLYDQVSFTGVDLVDVSKDVSVQAGSNGSAQLSLVTDQFSSVPEPGTFSMLGLGTVALVGFARRKLNL
jgi:hypothetical protein